MSPSHNSMFLRGKSDDRVMSKKGKEIALPPEGVLGRYLGWGGGTVYA